MRNSYRRRSYGALLCISLVALVCGVGIATVHAFGTIELVGGPGSSSVLFQGELLPATSGLTLLTGMTLSTTSRGTIGATCANGNRFALSGGTEVFLDRSPCDDTATGALDVVRGTVDFTASSTAGDGAAVRTPLTLVRAVTPGAVFTVTYEELFPPRNGVATTRVQTGTVAVIHAETGLPTILNAGEMNRFPGLAPVIVAAVLPSSRSLEVGKPGTVFATMLNTGNALAIVCKIVAEGQGVILRSSVYATEPATNRIIGAKDTPVSIRGGGGQSFLIEITPSVPIAPTDLGLGFQCANTSVARISGVNTLQFSASATPVADIVALVATRSNDGILNIPGVGGSGAFAVATVNVGAIAAITVSADTGSATLPLSITMCQTIPATGQCISPIGPNVSTAFGAGQTGTFGIFATGNGTIPLDPAVNRIFIRFRDATNTVRGSTSVAVRTQ